jgi:glycosyltransferase involved in cell wall biosynthesis
VITSNALSHDLGNPFINSDINKKRVDIQKEETNGVKIERVPYTLLEHPIEESIERLFSYVLKNSVRHISPLIGRIFQDPVGPRLLISGIRSKPDIIHSSSVTDSSIAVSVALGIYHDVPSSIRPAWHIGNESYNINEWRPIFNLADQIITSTSTEKEYLSNNGVEPRNIRVIGYGVDFDEIQDSEPDPSIGDDDKFTVLIMTSRMTRSKGVPQVLDVAPCLPDVEFIIAGPESKMLDEIPENCKYIGKIFGEKKHRILNSVDAFVLPSTAESFGIAYMEAMSAGVPVVTADIPISNELYSESGIQVDPNDSEELKSSILRLKNDGDIYEEYSKNAENTARKYSWENITRKTEESWKNIV